MDFGSGYEVMSLLVALAFGLGCHVHVSVACGVVCALAVFPAKRGSTWP